MTSRMPRLGVAVATLGLLLAGCGSSAQGTPDSVVLTEWRIQAEKPTDTTLHVRNEGSRQHQLVVSRAGGHVLAMTDLLEPGESTEVLLPEIGKLELSSRLVSVEPDGTVVDDTANGMFIDVDWRR
ncbi:MAG: hypothetical protein Q8P61_09625 [Candidatus Nanopelagicales bacterium]|nr:hypothetical protein [Candidatus Nanopelagicales bacterium]